MIERTKSGGGGPDSVTNPGTSTDNAIARFDGVTGKIIQDSGVLIDDFNNVILPNNKYLLGQNFTDTLGVNLIGIDASDNILIGRSTGYNIRVRSANLISDVDGQCNLGSGANAFGTLYITNVGTALTWPSNNATMRTAGAATTFGMSVISGDSSAGNSGTTLIGSGSATGGDSGDVTLQPGGATGTRGKVRIRNATEGTAGHILFSNDTTGGTVWQPQSSIDHNSLTNYAANQHIDHTTVAMNTAANSGLAGGGSIAASRSLGLDINNLATDTPVLSDLLAFYDASGGDNNKCTISEFLTGAGLAALLDPKVAHVRADGLGTHATINAAIGDANVNLVLAYPGYHTITNSSPLNMGAKSIIGIGGQLRTFLLRTVGTNNALRGNHVSGLEGVTLGDPSAQDAGTEYFYRYNSFSQTSIVIKNIALSAAKGLDVLNAYGVIFQNISATGSGLTGAGTMLRCGSASSSSVIANMKDCNVINFISNQVEFGFGALNITNCNFLTSTFGAPAAINMTNTATQLTTFQCIFDAGYYGVIADLGASAKWESNGDSFKNSFGENALLSGSGTVVLNSPSFEYASTVSGNPFSVSGGVMVQGSYFDQQTGNFVLEGKISLATTGAAPNAGNAVLVGGTKFVATTSVTAATIIMMNRKTAGGTPGTSMTYTLTPGVGFTITSNNVLDTSTISWILWGSH